LIPALCRVVWWCAGLVLGTAFHAAAHGFDHSHAAWTHLLRQHVVLISSGAASQVRYTGFQRDHTALNKYLGTLSAVTQSEFTGWSKAQQMAFLINAYNAFAIRKILTRYPDIGSIWDFGKVFGNPFRDRFFMLLDQRMSLDGVEHETLRKPGVYDEPRVHFAVNCASVGCPMLREEAYVAERLDAQLEVQTRRFLGDRTRNRYANGYIELSMIFRWYGEDWTRGYRGFSGKGVPISSLEAWLARYAGLLSDDVREQNLIRSGKAPLQFLDYDWTLNTARQRQQPAHAPTTRHQ